MTKQEVETKIKALKAFNSGVDGLIIKNTGKGYEWFGLCEVCHKRCDNHFQQCKKNNSGGNSIGKFGHVDCLKEGKWINSAVDFTV